MDISQIKKIYNFNCLYHVSTSFQPCFNLVSTTFQPFNLIFQPFSTFFNLIQPHSTTLIWTTLDHGNNKANWSKEREGGYRKKEAKFSSSNDKFC